MTNASGMGAFGDATGRDVDLENVHRSSALSLLRADGARMQSAWNPGRSHECERGSQECARHVGFAIQGNLFRYTTAIPASALWNELKAKREKLAGVHPRSHSIALTTENEMRVPYHSGLSGGRRQRVGDLRKKLKKRGWKANRGTDSLKSCETNGTGAGLADESVCLKWRRRFRLRTDFFTASYTYAYGRGSVTLFPNRPKRFFSITLFRAGATISAITPCLNRFASNGSPPF